MTASIAGDLLRSSDFPNGIQTPTDLARLGALLNPRLKKLQALTSQGVNLGQHLDGQVLTFQVATPADAFTAPTLTNGWVNYGGGTLAAGYYKDAAGIVHLRGTVASGTIGAAIFTLPAGYRPSATAGGAVLSNNAFGSVIISAAGVVTANTGSNVNFVLDGITLLAADASPGILPPFPQQLRIADRRRPAAVLLLSCQDHSQANPHGTPNSGATTPSILVPGLQWSYLAANDGPNLLSIDGMPGLALGRTYDVSVLVLFQ